MCFPLDIVCQDVQMLMQRMSHWIEFHGEVPAKKPLRYLVLVASVQTSVQLQKL